MSNWDFETPLEIRYAETDAMGLVHHANYVVWFELARVRFLESLGLPYHEMEARDWLIPVLEIGASYLRPLRFGDQPNIKLKFEREGSSKFGFKYEIYLGDVCTSQGFSKHVFMNRAGRPQRPPVEFLERIESISSNSPLGA